jgi:hypothetical protein
MYDGNLGFQSYVHLQIDNQLVQLCSQRAYYSAVPHFEMMNSVPPFEVIVMNVVPHCEVMNGVPHFEMINSVQPYTP